MDERDVLKRICIRTMGVVIPIKAVCSTRRRGAIVSLKSSDGILRELGRRVRDVVSVLFHDDDDDDIFSHLAASSRMRHWPPVPFVPFEEGSTLSRTTLSPLSVSKSSSRDYLKKKPTETSTPLSVTVDLEDSFYKIRRFDGWMSQKIPRVRIALFTPEKKKSIAS